MYDLVPTPNVKTKMPVRLRKVENRWSISDTIRFKSINIVGGFLNRFN